MNKGGINLFELRVGTIVIHQGEKKRITEKIKRQDISNRHKFVYKLKSMENGLVTQSFIEDIKVIEKIVNKFEVGQSVVVNYGEYEGKRGVISRVFLGLDDFGYLLIIDKEKEEMLKIREDFLEILEENDNSIEYKINDTVKCRKNGRIGTVVNTSKAVRNRYKLEFYDGYTLWVYGYELSLIGSEETAKDDKVELSKEDYFSILSLAVDLGDKDLLDTYKEKVNGI